MTATLLRATESDIYKTTLASDIVDSTASIIEIASPVSGVTIPGVLIIDFETSTGVQTPTLREYISFTTINAQQISGLTRGLGGSTAQSHGAGAQVWVGPSQSYWNNMVDFLQAEHSEDGTHVMSTPTINFLRTANLAVTSLVSVNALHISSHLNTSGASVTGILEKSPMIRFQVQGTFSGATSNVQTPVVMPSDGTWSWLNVVTASVASAASVVFDINLNGTSIFDAGTRPSIVGAGTFVSTASFATAAFSEGDQISWDFDGPDGVDGLITDFNILIKAA